MCQSLFNFGEELANQWRNYLHGVGYFELSGYGQAEIFQSALEGCTHDPGQFFARHLSELPHRVLAQHIIKLANQTLTRTENDGHGFSLLCGSLF